MDFGGCKVEKDIVSVDIFVWQDCVVFYGVYREFCKVIVVWGIYVWYFGGFVVDQCCFGQFVVVGNVCDYISGCIYVQCVGCKIIEEKQGFCFLNYEIVDVYCYQIYVDGVVFFGFDCNFEFGVDIVIGGYQYWIGEVCFFEIKQVVKFVDIVVCVCLGGGFD